jgi:hypothetical protein
MKRPVSHKEDPAVADRRRALGRAFYDLRRAERDDAQRMERPKAPSVKKKATQER